MTSSRLILITAALLSVPTLWVVYAGASEQPYVRFVAREAAVQVGVASALMTVWAGLAVFIGAKIGRRALGRGWLSVGAVCVLAVFLLYQSPAGYLSELTQWSAGR